MAHYAFLNNDHTTETLREELMALSNEMSNLTSIEEPTPDDIVVIEAKQEDIDSKQEEINNCLCLVTGVITGVLETYEKSVRDETIEKEISDLEESRTADKTQEEITAIEAEIQVKLEELHALPPDVIDNTIYWEGYYGKGGLCKRTSYNTVGGVHKNSGTPFRKNYAGVGMTYDPVRDAFYAPQTFESWTLNEESCLWECPIERPEGEYWWKEDTTEWVNYEYYSELLTYNPPYPSWIWNTSSGLYEAPIAEPDIEDKNSYIWSEENGAWMLWNDDTEKWEII
tara:strand:+ start:160 stop:1011 length:852 start_codon:yes stop_codon:yes gene_type:complete